MKKAAVFLAITFLLSWPAMFWNNAANVPMGGAWIAVSAAMMFTPMIAAIVTQKLICKEPVVKPLRISFRLNRWFLIALVTPAVLAGGIVAASLLMPGVALVGDVTRSNGFLYLRSQLSPDKLAAMIEMAGKQPIHPAFMVLIGGTLAGLTINGVAGFGEELGWRGLLLREFERFGFWRASFGIGAIWGLWHLPFIVAGFNYPGHPIAGVFMMIAWCAVATPVFVYVCVRAKSVIAPSILHGAFNGVAMAPMLVLAGGNPLLAGTMGLAGMLTWLVMDAIILAIGKPGEAMREFNQW